MAQLNKLLFCGTPEFSVPILTAIASQYPGVICGVVTRVDAPTGRGRKLQGSPVKAAAEQLGIPVYQPHSTRELKSVIRHLAPDLVVVVAYGLIFPKSIVDTYYCMNIHASYLPHLRGASPIHSAILSGDSHTGITLIRMNATMDAGPILASQQIPITDNDHFESLHNRLANLGAHMTLNFISNWLQGPIFEQEQVHTAATFCHKLTPDDAKLDPTTMSSLDMFRRIRAFSQSPGAWIQDGNRRVKILDAELLGSSLSPRLVRPEGKNIMAYSDYLLGNPPLPL